MKKFLIFVIFFLIFCFDYGLANHVNCEEVCINNITILDNTVPHLAVSMSINNKKNVDKEAFLLWNLTKLNGVVLDFGNKTLSINKSSEKNYTVFLTTNYTGKVKIKFVLFYDQGSIEKYEIFETEKNDDEKISFEKTLPTGREVAVDKKTYKIEIINYPDEIEIQKGWFGHAKIIVKNTGSEKLNNVKLFIENLNSSWFEFSDEVKSIDPGGSANFTIKFFIPESAESGNYNGTFHVVAENTEDNKSFILRIYSSEYELVYYQLQTISEHLEKIEEETQKYEKEGKNVETVKEILENAKTEIAIARGYLNSKIFSKAKNKIENVEILLERARIELRLAKPKEQTNYFEPSNYYLLVIILIFGIGAFYLFKVVHLNIKRITSNFEIIKSKRIAALQDIKNIVTSEESKNELIREKNRILENIKLIEKEYRDGVISEESYKEFKKIFLKRLEEIENKIKEKENV